MKYIKYQDQNVSAMAAGCMRITGFTAEETDTFIRSVLDLGINFFDHADIYGGGHCEELFGEVFKKDPSLRDRMFIQSKCGIRKGCFDFSYAHIMEAVEGILERLHTDHLDSLL
ncbi:MAG: aldo/keto reductase, partial [Erysipelotrichaceae bacterium]|nr:aldo/keto reductase [Erysipelotrichaceae bacterium]